MPPMRSHRKTASPKVPDHRRSPAAAGPAPAPGPGPGPTLERARRLGHRVAGVPAVQRKIGAEIEVPGAFLVYDKTVKARQGEKVGALVPGIETEIHLEGPEDGEATLEFATGLFDQEPPDSPVSLTYQTGTLAIWTETAKMLGKQWLKDRALVRLEPKWQKVNGGKGPILDATTGAKGAFQVNVSPTKETAPKLLGAFDQLHAFSYDSEQGELQAQKTPINQALKDTKAYSIALYGEMATQLAKAAEKEPPPRILTVLRALANVPRVIYFRYLRGLEGWGTPTLDIIDKNIAELLPRFRLDELWEKAVQDDPEVEWNGLIFKALDNAVQATDFPRLKQKEVPDSLDFKVAMEVMEIEEGFEKLSQLPREEMLARIGEYEKLDSRLKELKEEHGVRKTPILEHGFGLQKEALAEMLAVLSGKKVLVQDREVAKSEQPPSVLKGTDSSLRPVNRQQGEAGVFEVRNPFTHQLKVTDWEKAMALYETELRKAGVRY